MSTQLQEQLEEHAEHIANLREKVGTHAVRIKGLEDAMQELRPLMMGAATSDEVNALRTDMHNSINTLLRDALAAVPQKAIAWFAGVTALLALLAYLSGG